MKNLNLQIRWKNLDKDPLVESYFYEKLFKLLEFQFVHADEVFKAEVVYYAKSNNYRAALTFGVKGKPDVRAESNQSSSLQHAINELIEKALDQLRRIKTQFRK